MQPLLRQLLAELGEDPGREGLVNTPKRVEKALTFLTSGYASDIDHILNGALFTVDQCSPARERRDLCIAKRIRSRHFRGGLHSAFNPNG